MKLGCRWEGCAGPATEYRRIIMDTVPVTHIGLCTAHGEAYDHAVTRGGIEVDQRIHAAVTVRPA